jgi:hypothetical protein
MRKYMTLGFNPNTLLPLQVSINPFIGTHEYGASLLHHCLVKRWRAAVAYILELVGLFRFIHYLIISRHCSCHVPISVTCTILARGLITKIDASVTCIRR